MIVIGVDAHKRTHTLVALDGVIGVSRGEKTIQASEDGALDAWRTQLVVIDRSPPQVDDLRDERHPHTRPRTWECSATVERGPGRCPD
jgi:hypothetical protein